MSRPLVGIIFAAVAALAILISPAASAAVITMDFEGVQPFAGNGPAYLNSYGITLSNLSPSGTAGTVDIYNYSGPGSFWLNNNFLQQNGAGAVPCSYTLNFSTPLKSISFTRVATPFNLTTEPQWLATAYVGVTGVGSVGESLGTWGNSPAKTFSLTGNGITSLNISANGFGFTAIGSVPLDDFVLTTVPEPSTIVLGAVGAVAIGAAIRKRKSRRDRMMPTVRE